MKRITTTTTFSSIVIAAALLGAGCTSPLPDVKDRQDPNITSVGQISSGFDTWGRKWGDEPAPAPAPAQAPAAEPVKTSCSDTTGGLVRMSKKMPAEATLGQQFYYELNLVSQACVGNVVVTDHVPPGASYVRSEPPAQVDGDRLIWKFSDMNPGDAKTIKVWLRADQEGTLASCATISADPRVCAGTFVGKPNLIISKSGPDTAILNSDVAYTIVVANKGTSVAKNVVVTDNVPDGLASSSGQSQLSWNVGDLGPNQSKTIPVTLKAVKRGKACNDAVATSSNAGKVDAEACTTVLVPGIKITKGGTKEQFLGRKASYDIVVSNTGDTTLTGVTVTDNAPAGTTVLSASGGSVNGNTITWNVGDLKSGAQQSFSVVLTSAVAGEHCNAASVSSAQGLHDSAQACTVWKGVSALLLEKSDDPDPIQVGETSTYTVKVTNQGTADDTNVKVVVMFPEEITPISADNNGVVDGKTVTYPAYPVLHAKQAFTFHCVGKGVSTGDARVKFVRTSDNIPAPTSAEESTRVF